MSDDSDERAVEVLAEAYTCSGYEIRAILDVLFRSEFFKEAMFKRVKCPAELVAGTLRITDEHRDPYDFGLKPASETTSLMGQKLLDPPTVEGWHTGQEWIDGGTLNERINFAVNLFTDLETPGMNDILDRLGHSVNSADLVDSCLDIMGSIEVSDDTQKAMERYADAVGDIDLSSHQARTENAVKVAGLIQLIVATREYQFA